MYPCSAAVRAAMLEGLELTAAVRGVSAVVLDAARRGASGEGLTVSAVRRLVRWHVEHPGDVSPLALLHGGRGGETWGREVLQRHADACGRGEHLRGAGSFGTMLRAVGAVMGGDARATLGAVAGVVDRVGVAAHRGAAVHETIRRAVAAPVSSPAPVGGLREGDAIAATVDGRPVRAWVSEVGGVAGSRRRP